jgi:N-acetylglucosamine-6-phosphate deacetylase
MNESETRLLGLPITAVRAGGSLEAGNRADLVLWSEKLDVCRVFIGSVETAVAPLKP